MSTRSRLHTGRVTQHARHSLDDSPHTRQRNASHPHLVLQRAHANDASLTPADVLTLQRTVGNKATARLLQPMLQAKLKLGSADDTREREADRVADQVVRQSERSCSPVQRQTGDKELQKKPVRATARQSQQTTAPPNRTFTLQRNHDEEEMVQTKPFHGPEGGDVETSVEQQIQQARGRGQVLNGNVRRQMEQGFGVDFSSVRIHTGPKAETLNRSLNARAFTTGTDIFFGNGEYNPGSSGGKRLLAHELIHVVQQDGSGAQRVATDGASSRGINQDSNEFMVRRTIMTPGQIKRAGGEPSKRAIKNKSTYYKIVQALDGYHKLPERGRQTVLSKVKNDAFNDSQERRTLLQQILVWVTKFLKKYKSSKGKSERREAVETLRQQVQTEIEAENEILNQSYDDLANNLAGGALAGIVDEAESWGSRYRDSDEEARSNLMGTLLRGQEAESMSQYVMAVGIDYLQGLVGPAITELAERAEGAVQDLPETHDNHDVNTVVADFYAGVIETLFTPDQVDSIPQPVALFAAMAADEFLNTSDSPDAAFQVLVNVLLLRYVNPYIMSISATNHPLALKMSVLLQYQANRVANLSKVNDPAFIQVLKEYAPVMKQFIIDVYKKGGGGSAGRLADLPALRIIGRDNEEVID